MAYTKGQMRHAARRGASPTEEYREMFPFSPVSLPPQITEPARPSDKAIVYCDGGCPFNGWNESTGYGSFRIESPGYAHIERVNYPRGQTNNTAEYQTLIAALEYCRQHKISKPQIYADSALVVHTVNGKWKVHKPHLIPLRDSAQSLLRLTRGKLNWVPREEIVSKLGH